MAVWRYITRTNTKLLDVDPQNPGEKDDLPVSVNAVFYVDIPDVNNPAGVNYRVAAKDEQWNREANLDPENPGGGVVPMIVDLAAKNLTVYNNLQIGAVYQVSETVKFSSAYLTNIERDAEVDARMAVVEDEIIAKKQKEWMYWGNTDTV